MYVCILLLNCKLLHIFPLHGAHFSFCFVFLHSVTYIVSRNFRLTICIHMARQWQISNAFKWKSIVLRTRWSIWKIDKCDYWLLRLVFTSLFSVPFENVLQRMGKYMSHWIISLQSNVLSYKICENAKMCHRQANLIHSNARWWTHMSNTIIKQCQSVNICVKECTVNWNSETQNRFHNWIFKI